MNGFTVTLIFFAILLASFFMLCACRLAAISDEQDERLFKQWLAQQQKEVEP